MKRFIKQRLEGWLHRHPAWRPWGWFILLWLGGLLAVASISYGLRWVMRLG